MDTLTFSFLFLPAAMLVFYTCPPKYKNAALAAASVLFYAANDFRNLPLMLLSVLFDYLVCAKLVRSTVEQAKSRRLVFWTSIIKNIAVIIASMAVNQLGKAPLALGVMVYTLTSMGYVIDVYNGDERFDGSIVDYILFTCFWGKLYAGPIVQYSQLKEQWGRRDLSLEKIQRGARLYVSGLGKLVILAAGNVQIHQAIQAIPQGKETVLSVWLFIISTTFSLYYTLTGYCDMASGLANLFGMDFPENFHYPFQSRTVSDFFNRFNITVTKFINSYVYVFLGADTNGVLPTIANTLLTTLLMGLWFGLRINYLVWGIYFTVFILLEKYFLMNYLKKLPPILDRIYTFVIVMFSFTIFSGNSLRETGRYILSMFGMNGLALLNNNISYIFSSNYLVILLSFFFATSLISIITEWVRKKMARTVGVLESAACFGIFIVAVSFMI